MKPWRRIFTYLATFPNDLLVAWPIILLVRLFWGERLRWEGEALVCQLRSDSWPTRSWYRHKVGGQYVQQPDGTWRTWGGTTFGRAIMYGPNRSPSSSPDRYLPVQRHEHVHVEQCEVAMTQSLVAGLIAWAAGAPWWAGLIVWTLGYIMMAASGWVVAWLRGEDPYAGSTHEESAYGQTDGHPRG